MSAPTQDVFSPDWPTRAISLGHQVSAVYLRSDLGGEPELTRDQLADVLREAVRIGAGKWVLGDAINAAGGRRICPFAAEVLGKSVSIVYRYARTARDFPPAERMPAVGYRTHELVRNLPIADRRFLLAEVTAGRMKKAEAARQAARLKAARR
jgi:hypothetical protein